MIFDRTTQSGVRTERPPPHGDGAETLSSMTTTGRRPARGRLAAIAAALVAAVGLVLAPAAFAATPASWDGTAEWGGYIYVNGGDKVQTRLYNIAIEGSGTVKAYCVDRGTPINKGDVWDIHPLGSQITNPEKVQWILEHSYPVLTVAQLRTAAGIPGLDTHDVIMGTQAALWFYSNGNVLDDTADNSDDVKALYAYFTGPANVGSTTAPAPTLSLSPASTQGKTGERVGPITVSWSGSGSVAVAAPGFTLYSAKTGGSAVTTAQDGDQLWIEIPAGTPQGTVTITANGTAQVSGGLILINPDTPEKVQKLAYAGVQAVAVSATAAVIVPPSAPTPTPSTTTPTPTPTEPGTGTPTPTPSTSTPTATPSTSTPTPTGSTPTEPGTSTPSTSGSTPSETTTEPGLPDTGAQGIGTTVLVGLSTLALGALLLVVASRAPRRGRHSA